MATKKSNGKSAAVERYERIGKETRIVKREIGDEERAAHKKWVEKDSRDEEAKLKASFREFKRALLPKIDAVLDPGDVDGLDESQSVALDDDDLDYERARGLSDAIETERKITAAKIAMIKAERRQRIDMVANRYEWRAIECDVEADNERLTVRYVDPTTGEVIDTRGMTEAERQMALDVDELPAGAPAAVQ